MMSDVIPDHVAATLFVEPPGRFVAARNALAATLVGDVARHVRALPKPPISAWAVNLLYWQARPRFEALVRVGEQLRASQRRLLAGHAGGSIRDMMAERQDAVRAAMTEAAALATRAGVSLSPPMRERVKASLEAIATLGKAAPADASGRLARDLQPPGLEALVGLAAGGSKGGTGSAGPTRAPKVPVQRVEDRPAEAGPDDSGHTNVEAGFGRPRPRGAAIARQEARAARDATAAAQRRAREDVRRWRKELAAAERTVKQAVVASARADRGVIEARDALQAAERRAAEAHANRREADARRASAQHAFDAATAPLNPPGRDPHATIRNPQSTRNPQSIRNPHSAIRNR